MQFSATIMVTIYICWIYGGGVYAESKNIMSYDGISFAYWLWKERKS